MPVSGFVIITSLLNSCVNVCWLNILRTWLRNCINAPVTGLQEHADILSAIEHALAAKDYEYAACLIAPQSQQWMQRGEISTIIKYLNQLPRDKVWNDWSLCLWYGWSYAVSGDLSHAERWTNRLETLITPLIQDATLKENGPIPSELQNAYVQVLAIRSVTARQNKDFASAIALDEQALRLVPEDNLNLQTIISALLSSAVLEAGRFDQAESLLHSTRKSAYRTGQSIHHVYAIVE